NWGTDAPSIATRRREHVIWVTDGQRLLLSTRVSREIGVMVTRPAGTPHPATSIRQRLPAVAHALLVERHRDIAVDIGVKDNDPGAALPTPLFGCPEQLPADAAAPERGVHDERIDHQASPGQLAQELAAGGGYRFGQCRTHQHHYHAASIPS